MIDQTTTSREKINVRTADPLAVALLMKQLEVPFPIAQILVLRNVRTPEECIRYFNPELSHLLDPFLFSDMEKVTGRILSAVRNKEKIVVYGDYDVDGI